MCGGGTPDRGTLGARLVEAVAHRSRAGPEREVTIWGVPACARCMSLGLGAIVGGLVVNMWLPPWWLVVGVVPAWVDAVAEKTFGAGHRPRLLVVANALGGAVLGGTLIALARAHGELVVSLALVAARVLLTPLLAARRQWNKNATATSATATVGG